MQTPETFPWELLGEVMPCCMHIPNVHVQLASLSLKYPIPHPSILTTGSLICSSQHLIGCLRHPGNHLTNQFFLHSAGPVSYVALSVYAVVQMSSTPGVVGLS